MANSKPSRVVFAGTPAFAVPALRTLIDLPAQIVAVFTQPDRPAGRGRKLVGSPVKALAMEHDLPVFQPPTFDAQAERQLADQDPELMIVVAYGLLLPQAALAAPARGCINIHASLLPRWRGAAPIARAIEAGDRHTGVCLMKMTQGLDEGPVYAQAMTDIGDTDTAADLHDRLAVLGADLLRDNFQSLVTGTLEAIPQHDAGVTYAKKLRKAEAPIDWSTDAAVIARRIRAFNPWPVATTQHNGTTIKLWSATSLEPNPQTQSPNPGTICEITKQHVRISGVNGDVAVTSLQRPGGKVLSAAAFCSGYTLRLGERFT